MTAAADSVVGSKEGNGSPAAPAPESAPRGRLGLIDGAHAHRRGTDITHVLSFSSPAPYSADLHANDLYAVFYSN